MEEKITLNLEVDYDKYREFLIIKLMDELNEIYYFFDEENNKIIIMLFILNIKLVDKSEQYLLNQLMLLILKLNEIIDKSINQKEYLYILLNLTNTYTIIEKIKNKIEKIKEEKKIKFEGKFFFENIKIFFEKIKKNNKLFESLTKIIDQRIQLYSNKKNSEDSEIIRNENIIRIEIEKICSILSKDYFIYYNSNEMIRIIYEETKIIDNNFIPTAIIKNKDLFEKKYKINYEKYKEAYKNEKNKEAMFKNTIKNENFENLMKDIKNLNYL